MQEAGWRLTPAWRYKMRGVRVVSGWWFAGAAAADPVTRPVLMWDSCRPEFAGPGVAQGGGSVWTCWLISGFALHDRPSK
jgi:hypothetical protein